MFFTSGKVAKEFVGGKSIQQGHMGVKPAMLKREYVQNWSLLGTLEREIIKVQLTC